MFRSVMAPLSDLLVRPYSLFRVCHSLFWSLFTHHLGSVFVSLLFLLASLPSVGFELMTFEHPVGLALCGFRTCVLQVFFPVLLFNIRRFSSGMLSLRVGHVLVPGVSLVLRD